MEYQVVRSSRKTVAAQITAEGVVVRAPLRMTDKEIAAFVEKNRDKIEKYLERARTRRESLPDEPPLTTEDIKKLANEALDYIPRRVAHFAPLVGVSYGRITIRNQKSKWGSCSAKGNLNFNCLLMLCPKEVIDSVVVHELCHRKEMNHSKDFYAQVLRVFPEYHQWNNWLKEHGPAVMRRMTTQGAPAAPRSAG